MAMNVSAFLPVQNTPIVGGLVCNPDWYRFFQKLVLRTGGSGGIDLSTIEAQVTAATIEIQNNALDIAGSASPTSTVQAGSIPALMNVMERAMPLHSSMTDQGIVYAPPGQYLIASVAASTYATMAQATTALVASGGTINGITIGLTVPAAAAFTTLSANGLVSPTYPAGIAGNKSGASVTAGSVGEKIESIVTSIPLTTLISTNLTSITLTPGDWDLFGGVTFRPAALTAIINTTASFNTASAALASSPFTAINTGTFGTGGLTTLAPPPQPFNVSVNTTIFLVVNSQFSGGTLAADGYIVARRR